MKDAYEVLGVPRDAPANAVRLAYKRLAAKHHPDRGGDTSAFQAVKEAYETLSDPERREKLDGEFSSGGSLQAATLDYINLTVQYADKNGVCSTCGGKGKVKVAVGRIGYQTLACPKCGKKPENS